MKKKTKPKQWLLSYRINGHWQPQATVATHEAGCVQGDRACRTLNIDGYKVTPL